MVYYEKGDMLLNYFIPCQKNVVANTDRDETCAAQDGKVECNTIVYTTPFLYSG